MILFYFQDLSECCMPRGLLHVTLGMLRLSGQQGEEEAARMLDELRPVLNEFGRRRALKLNIRGLDTFGQRVLYGAVQPEPKYKIQQCFSNHFLEFFFFFFKKCF